MAESEIEARKRLLLALTFADDKAWKYPFAKMCKNYGKAFIDELQMSWAVNFGCLSEEEFCTYHELPNGFFISKIRGVDYSISEKDNTITVIIN